MFELDGIGRLTQENLVLNYLRITKEVSLQGARRDAEDGDYQLELKIELPFVESPWMISSR